MYLKRQFRVNTNMKETFNSVQSLPTDLQAVEALLVAQLTAHLPDVAFRARLKEGLMQARIFRQRRSYGAMWVATLSVMLTGALTFSIWNFIARARSQHYA